MIWICPGTNQLYRERTLTNLLPTMLSRQTWTICYVNIGKTLAILCAIKQYRSPSGALCKISLLLFMQYCTFLHSLVLFFILITTLCSCDNSFYLFLEMNSTISISFEAVGYPYCKSLP